MRFRKREAEERERWNLWFAWRPVKVEGFKDRRPEWVWLEIVQRRAIVNQGEPVWVYRSLDHIDADIVANAFRSRSL